MSMDTYLPVQDREHCCVDVLHSHSKVDSHDAASCRPAHDWMQRLALLSHWQFGSALQAPFVAYIKPHFIVHVLMFHWQMLCCVHWTLFVLRSHDVVQDREDGFHEQPRWAMHNAWLKLVWQLGPQVDVAAFHWQLASPSHDVALAYFTAHFV